MLHARTDKSRQKLQRRLSFRREDEEGREEREERGKREKERDQTAAKTSWPRTLYGFNTCMSVFVNVTQRAWNTPIFDFIIQQQEEKKKESHTNVIGTK